MQSKLNEEPEESISDKLNNMQKENKVLEKKLRSLEKEKELDIKRNKRLKQKKLNSVGKIKQYTIVEERLSLIKVDKNIKKKILLEKKKKELDDLKKKKSLNSNARMKRNNTSKNLKTYLANKNKQKAISVKKQSKLINEISNKFKETNKKNNKDNLKIARTIHKSAILQKKDEEDYNKTIRANEIEKENQKKIEEMNKIKPQIQKLEKDIQDNKKYIIDIDKKLKLNKFQRSVKTAKNSKKRKFLGFNKNKIISEKDKKKIQKAKVNTEIKKAKSDLNKKNALQKKDIKEKVDSPKRDIKDNNNIQKKDIKEELDSKKSDIKDNSDNKIIMIDPLKRQKELREKKLSDETIHKENEEKIEKEEKEEEEKKLVNKKINQTLEDMLIHGINIKNEIMEKQKNPDKYIETKEALKLEEKDKELFSLGLLSKTLESLGIETIIEKDENKNEDNNDNQGASETTLQFLSNGYLNKKKYKLNFDFGKDRNEELLNDKKEYEKFKENLLLKISKDYKIPTDKIIVTYPQKGSFEVQVIFQSDEFNDLDAEEFKDKFKNEENEKFSELKNLKEIHSDVIMEGCKLTKKMLDARGNRYEGWGQGEKRGNMPYDPPLGWIGIGLKVMDVYDNGDNTWIGMNNNEGEWCVAYHGVGRYLGSDQVKNITGKIIKGEKQKFKPGNAQVHEDCNDKFHKGKKVGLGVYCTPTIKTAEHYSGKSNINGVDYKTVLMVRVKPQAIRCCEDCSFAKDYWVLNGTCDEIRPYRILYKKGCL